MSAMVCIVTGGLKNEIKRARNGRAGHVLWCMQVVKKIKKSERMAEGVREDVGGKLWQANGFAVRYNVHMQVKWKKTNNGVKRNENEQLQIYVYVNQTKREKKITVRNGEKINVKRWNNAKGTSHHNIACNTRLQTQKQANSAVRNIKRTRKYHREKPAKNKKYKNK